VPIAVEVKQVEAVTILTDAFKAGVACVKPDRLIRDHVKLSRETLTIGEETFDLNGINRIMVAGAGKASGLMAAELEKVMGDRLSEGTVVVKYGHGVPCRIVEIVEAGHPYPDQAGVEATRKMVSLCQGAGENDLVLFLLSGGGSALLADYPEGCSLADVAYLSKLLVNSGADIREINAVRKHLSRVKGGQLARMAFPATVVSLILSDVVGDPLDVIASGPTVADRSTFADALGVCRRYGIEARVPQALMRVLVDGAAGRVAETPKTDDPLLARTTNLVIGSNRLALEACLRDLRKRGIEGEIVTDRLDGDTEAAAATIVSTALERKRRCRTRKPFALLFGGETTLKVTGNGNGGRNQHMALKAAWLLRGQPGITFLAAGTDGTDGPTEMAGAVVDGETCERAAAQGMNAQESLRAFDSYSFFRVAGGHVFTGPTMTNVMDLALALVHD